MNRYLTVLFLLAIVAGCGGGSDTGGGETSGTPPTAPAAAATLPATASPTATATPTSTVAEPAMAQEGVLDLLASDGRFTILSEIVHAGLPYFVEFMQAPDWNHTLFAPTDDAFAALPPTAVDAMRSGQVSVIRFLDHLTLPVVLPAAELESVSYDTVGQGGPPLEITIEGEVIRLDDAATVIDTDLEAANGIIHAIDTVIGVDYILRTFD